MSLLNTQQLIPISTATGSPAVNARDLHAFLKNGDHFSTWIKERIDQFGFSEGTDFRSYSASADKPQGGRPSKEYALSLDMAKELSMVERNEKGKQARQYFIQCEQEFRKGKTDPLRILNDPVFMRDLLLSYSEKVISLETSVSELTPKADALDRLENLDGAMCITNAAKVLQVRPKDLFAYLTQNKWTYRRPCSAELLAYQSKIIQGVLSHKITVVSTSDGREKVCTQVLVTSKGLSVLAQEFARPCWQVV